MRRFSAGFGNSDHIVSFLEHNPGEYCDDCLSSILGIRPRQQVNQICNRLNDYGSIRRGRGRCSSCHKNKLVNFAYRPTINSTPQKIESKESFKSKEAIQQNHLQDAERFMSNKQYAEAIESFDLALMSNDNDSTIIYREVGIAHSYLGEYSAAVQSLNRAFQVDSSILQDAKSRLAPDILGNLSKEWSHEGAIFIERGQYAEALEAVNCSLTLFQYDPITWCRKGRALLGQGRYHEALDAINNSLELYPANATVIRIKVLIHNVLREESEEFACYSDIINIDPTFPDIWYDRGMRLYTQDHLSEALESVERAIKTDPNNIFAHILKGDIASKLGRNNDAIFAYTQAESIGGSKIELLEKKAKSLKKSGKHLAALLPQFRSLILRINPRYKRILPSSMSSRVVKETWMEWSNQKHVTEGIDRCIRDRIEELIKIEQEEKRKLQEREEEVRQLKESKERERRARELLERAERVRREQFSAEEHYRRMQQARDYYKDLYG